MDAEQRSCTVTAANKNYNVILKVNFPGNYPYNASPSFQFCPGTTIDNTAMAKLSKVLKQTAQQRVRKNRSCLEPCLRQLITTLEQMCVSEESEGKHLGYRIPHSSNFINSTSIFPNYQDTYIPFPRTSGAKFCCVGEEQPPKYAPQSIQTLCIHFPGTLVCFGRTPYARRPSIKPESTTPRALSALGAGMSSGGHFPHIYPPYSQSNATDNISISSFYFHERVSRVLFKIINLLKLNAIYLFCYLREDPNEVCTDRAACIPKFPPKIIPQLRYTTRRLCSLSIRNSLRNTCGFSWSIPATNIPYPLIFFDHFQYQYHRHSRNVSVQRWCRCCDRTTRPRPGLVLGCVGHIAADFEPIFKLLSII